jgi:hypothetical protein
MLMATLVGIGGQGAKAQLVNADYRKFAQCELATHGYLTAVREPQQVPKTGVTAILLATLSSGKTSSWGKRVLAIALFSATAFGLATLSSYLPRTGTSSLGMAVAAADPCGDGCGGGGNGQGSYGPDTSGFQPPGMPNQLPDYQSGANSGYPAPDQAVSQVTQQAGQQGATQTASQGLPKPPPPDSWSGQITNTPDPTTPNANNALTMAQLVQRVYDPTHPLPAGWSQLSSAQVEQLTGINPDNMASGVHVGVLTDGAGHYVGGFAGAENQFDDAAVVVEEVGGDPPQYQMAVQVMSGLLNNFGAGNVAATGHSMGGGEAAAGALNNGTTAITFEAQGLSPGYLQSLGMDPQATFAQAADGQVQHYFIEGEFATALQREIPIVNGLPNAPGLNYALPFVTTDPVTGATSISPVGPLEQSHNIAAVIDSLAQSGVEPQLVFTQPIPGEKAAEDVVNTVAPIVVLPIAEAVLGDLTPPPAPAP